VIAQQLSIPGIAQVNSRPAKPAVRVQVDPAKIAALGIQLETWPTSSCATVDSPKARSAANSATYIYDNDQLLKPRRGRRHRCLCEGAPVRIKDIGVAVDGRKTPRSPPGRVHGGNPAVFSFMSSSSQEPRHRRGVQGHGADAAHHDRAAAVDQSQSSRTQPPQGSVSDVEITLAIISCWWFW